MKWSALGAAGVFAVAVVVAPAAGADPDAPPPCGMLSPVCGMVPMMPELDHDLDLTTQYPNGGGLDTEHLPPADVCAVACI
jgi:hypothetical protein